jgi:TPR repeat protein
MLILVKFLVGFFLLFNLSGCDSHAVRRSLEDFWDTPREQLNRGLRYARGDGVTKDIGLAVSWYQRSAERGFAPAQHVLAGCYLNGEGVLKNKIEFLHWNKKAAEQGFSVSQYELGVYYLFKDFKLSGYWFRKAAEQGHRDAQFNLGGFYADGIGSSYAFDVGVVKNNVEAIKLWLSAGEKGQIEAQYYLAICYASGQHVAKSDSEAAAWFQAAAEQGHKTAQYRLGYLYDTGSGVAKDQIEAVKWYLKASNQGVEEAQYLLAISYLNGEGVVKSNLAAYVWATTSYRLGNLMAKDLVVFLKPKLNSLESAVADKRVETLISKIK